MSISSREEADLFALMGELIKGDGFELNINNFFRILGLLKDAKTHEQLLFIAPRKSSESFEQFNARVNAAARKLLFLMHTDIISKFNLTSNLIRLVEAAREAIDVAKKQLSSEETIKEDAALTENETMYYLHSSSKIKQYYPIGIEKLAVEITDVFSIKEAESIQRQRLEKREIEAKKKRAEEAKDQQAQRNNEEQERLQEVKKLLDCDVLKAIQKRIQDLNQKLNQEKIDIDACADEFKQISQAVNRENKGMLLRQYRFHQLSEQFEQVQETFFNFYRDIQQAHEALRKIINPLLDKHEAEQTRIKAESETLKEEPGFQIEHKKNQSGFLSFIKKHRNAILIIGVGLLVAIAIAATAGALAPMLAALPLVVGISFKLSMLAGAALTTKLIMGSLITAGALVGGLVASGITALVTAIVGRVKKRPAVERKDAVNSERSCHPERSEGSPSVNVKKEEAVSFRENLGTPGGLQTLGTFRQSEKMSVPEEAPPARPSPKPGFSDIDVD